MNKIIKKTFLTKTIVKMDIENEFIAKKCQPGQFIILRVCELGERIPLTIADYDEEKKTISIIFQIAGATTLKLSYLEEGQDIKDLVGPLGNKTKLNDLKKVLIIGGGVGCAISYPIAKKLFNMGATIHSIIGFRNENSVILEKEFNNVSNLLYVLTDDGSYKEKGLVTDKLKILLDNNKYDEVIAVGPLKMMKSVCEVTKLYNVKTTVSMNPIMIDGTGMCGGCRLRVGNEIKFACIDGPDFDGHLVDFDELIDRLDIYNDFEKNKYEETCNLFKKEIC